MRSRGLRSLAAGVVAVLALSACGANGGDDDSDSNDPTEGPSETTTPEGDELTEPGTELALGETAFIQWKPTQRLDAYVAVTVNRLDQVSIKEFRAFKLDEEMEASTPYYVQVTVENLGETDLSRVGLPIYLNDGSEVLIPAANITSAFEPCPNRLLPEKFVSGKKADLCMVFLAPQGRSLEAIVLRPEELAAAISWTGEITRPEKPKGDKGKGKNGKGKKGN